MNGAVTHDVITVALPFLVILAGTLFNNRAIARVEAELKSLRDETRADIKGLRDELGGEIKALRGEMDRRFDRVDDQLIRLHSVTANPRAVFRRLSAGDEHTALN